MRRIWEFTMVELLMVISVIMILTCLLLPALKKAKEAVQCTACANNMKQLGYSFSFYLDDNKECFPLFYEDSTIWPNQPGFKSYVGSGRKGNKEAIYNCPTIADHTFDYGINYHISCNNGWAKRYYQKIRRLSSCMLLGEINDGGTTCYNVRMLAYGSTNYDGLTYPHSGGMNILFGDFHVSSRRTPIPETNDYIWY